MTALADATDPRFTDGQRAQLRRFEVAPAAPESFDPIATVIICGPPKGCTCPAVAWTCCCEASEHGRRMIADRKAKQ